MPTPGSPSVFTNRRMLIAYALGAAAAIFLVLSLASYSVSAGVLNHVGKKIGTGCVSCALVLPSLIRTAIYGIVSAITGGLAAWFAIGNKGKEAFLDPEPELNLYPAVETDVETDSAEEQSSMKSERPPSRPSSLLVLSSLCCHSRLENRPFHSISRPLAPSYVLFDSVCLLEISGLILINLKIMVGLKPYVQTSSFRSTPRPH